MGYKEIFFTKKIVVVLPFFFFLSLGCSCQPEEKHKIRLYPSLFPLFFLSLLNRQMLKGNRVVTAKTKPKAPAVAAKATTLPT